MSKTVITVERVNKVEPHPDADRLEVIQVLGYRVVVQTGLYNVGDKVVYFPPDIMIPGDVSRALGVQKYLKHATYPGDVEPTQCRVAACRLRGQPSYGFVVPSPRDGWEFGTDVTQEYQGHKYIAPVRVGCGHSLPELPNFPEYTSIENVQRYPDLIPRGIEVAITEKLHGTSWRGGVVKHAGGYIEVAGSHRVRREGGMYWEPMDLVRNMLWALCRLESDVVAYGEIFGPGVQDMDYGLTGRSVRVFDLMVGGRYLPWSDTESICRTYGIPTVPVLAYGLYSPGVVEEFTSGPTTFDGVRGKFKGREGAVIRPRYQEIQTAGRRAIVKSVSVDYLNRRGGIDLGE